MKRLFLLDAYALIFRAYYGFIKKPLVNSKGQNTSAIFGFIRTLQDIRKGQRIEGLEAMFPEELGRGLTDADGLVRPDLIAVAFDPHGGTFRHREFPYYKAGREKTPEAITFAVPLIKELLQAYQIPILEVPDFEADDVIGTLSRQASATGQFITFMVSPDKDYAQLVTPEAVIFKPQNMGVGYEVLNTQAVCEKYSLQDTRQVIDMLALEGDKVDNISGLPGVGPKTALTLLRDFGSVLNLLEAVEQGMAAGKTSLPKLKEAMFAKVRDNLQALRDSYYLATIRLDVPSLPGSLFDTPLASPDYATLASLFDTLELRRLAEEARAALAASGESVPTEPAVQQTSQPAPLPVAPASLSTLADIDTHYTICQTQAEISALVNTLSTIPAWAFDTETTSLDVLTTSLVGLSFAIEGHKAWYIPCPADRQQTLARLDLLKPLFTSSAVKIAQNAKFDLLVLQQYGLTVETPLFDTMVAHYLLYPEQPHSMDYLAEVFLHYKPIPTSDLIDTAHTPSAKEEKPLTTLDELFSDASLARLNDEESTTKPATMRECPVEKVAQYCAEDSDVTFQLYTVLLAELEKNPRLLRLFNDIEIPLVYVLADMERTGVRLDVKALTESKGILLKEMERLQQRLNATAGVAFNPLSPKAAASIIYDTLKIAPAGNTKRSTAEDVLTTLRTRTTNTAHQQFIDDLLAYRGIKKLIGTYIDALPAEIHPLTGRIHCHFNQTITATGRLSSSHPNLQNIPIRDEAGRELRKAFVPDPGEVFFSADYSQIELRLMAHLSADPTMIEAFREGDDIHRATAAKIYHVTPEEVTKEQRTRAKTANFGIIYGISAFGLASRLNIPRSEAKALIDGYFATYPTIHDYMERSIATAREKGYVETLFGRRRELPDIHSANATVRGYAERNAINAPIQGSAADIIKLAMVRIAQRIKKENLHAKLLIQVHDELNFSVPPAELDALRTLVLDEMGHVIPLAVPLIADCGSGHNWLEAH